MVSQAHLQNWSGAHGQDYADACAGADYVDVVHRQWGDVLVLGDEPLPTAVAKLQTGVALIRWIYADNEIEIRDELSRLSVGDWPIVEEKRIRSVGGAFHIFDSALPGSSAPHLVVQLEAGEARCSTQIVKPRKALAFMLHMLSIRTDADAATP